MLPNTQAVDQSFAALAHPVRRGIVERLLDGEMTVGEIAAPYDMKKPTISRHLKVLENAGLITREIDGRQHHCRLCRDGLQELQSWIERYDRFWNRQLDRLGQFLEQEPTGSSS